MIQKFSSKMALKHSQTTFDVRDLLKVVNGVVVLLMWLAYSSLGETRYVDEVTILLGGVLALQTHIALSKRREPVDPFVIILLYYVTVYYTLRVVSLAFFDFSDVLRRFDYDPSDTNYALVFIIACNACMLLGFSLVRRPVELPRETMPMTGKNIQPALRSLLLLLLISVIGSFLGYFDWVSDQSRILRVCLFFLRSSAFLTLLGVLYVTYYQEIQRRYLYAYILLCLIFTVYLAVICGTRGMIIYIIEMFGVILLVNGKFLLSKRYFYKILVLIPLLGLLLVGGFNFATLQRNVSKESDARWGAAAGNLNAALVNGDGVIDVKKNVGHIASRVGFLDISSEIIAHESQYASILKPSYYAKSVVDNILTPGFDFYDTPKISYSLIFKHQNLNDGVPSKSYLKRNSIYHSDQLGVYGEMHAIFGWFSLPVLVVVAIALKWTYYKTLVARDRYGEVLKKFVILFFFVQFINSFGMDWIVVQMIPYVLTAFLLFVYYRRVCKLNANEASI